MSRKEFGVPFYELLVAVREGVSTPQQEQKLEQILLSDPEARQAYYEATDIDQGLTEIATFPRQLTSVAPPALREHSRWRTLVRYGAIAVASLAIGAALEWLIVSMPLRDQLVQRQRIAATASPPQFVATLVRSTDCTWAHEKSPLFEGQRLLSKDLQLNEGVAEFRLDSGIRLVLEGPSKLKINSAGSAFLEFGKIVLHGHELADGFELITPQATLIDVGTEYGASVDRDSNVELHVFQGSVRVKRTSDEGHGDMVEEGGARRFSGESTVDVPLRPGLFQREVPGQRKQSSITRDGLMAFDGFRTSDELPAGTTWHSNGTGWSENWKAARHGDTLSKALFDPLLKLHWDQVGDKKMIGALRLGPNRKVARRVLEHPIRMDTNAIYYISFFFQKMANAPRGTTQYGSVSLRSSTGAPGTQRMVFGMSSERMPILVHNEQQLSAAPPLQAGKPYLYVAKIISGENAPDQIQMRVFSSDEAWLEQEPHVWTCVSSPAFDDAVFDELVLYVEGAEYAVDEIRVASSWQALINRDWPLATEEAAPQE